MMASRAETLSFLLSCTVGRHVCLGLTWQSLSVSVCLSDFRSGFSDLLSPFD